MAKIKKNILLQGLSGTLNKQLVLKQYNNITVISSYPDMTRVIKSEKQKTENRRFREAVAYARSQMADPVSKAEYKAKARGLQKPHNIAIADFYCPPEIKSLDITALSGRKNDQIIIHAIDDFKVVRVEVTVQNEAGELLETGEARQLSKWKWEYRLQLPYETMSGFVITASAWDKPGNRAEKEVRI